MFSAFSISFSTCSSDSHSTTRPLSPPFREESSRSSPKKYRRMANKMFRKTRTVINARKASGIGMDIQKLFIAFKPSLITLLVVFAWSLLDDDMFTERYGDDDDGEANGVILVVGKKYLAHNMFRVSNPT